MKSAHDVIPKIVPIGIKRADKLDLPSARPVLDILLSLNGRHRGGMLFVIHKHLHAMLSRKARDHTFAVLVYAANEVIRHTDT